MPRCSCIEKRFHGADLVVDLAGTDNETGTEMLKTKYFFIRLQITKIMVYSN